MPGAYSDHYWALKIALTSFNTTAVAAECRCRLLDRQPCTDNMGRETAGYLFATSTWNKRGHAEIAKLLRFYLDNGGLKLDEMTYHPFRVPRVIRFSDGNALEGLDVDVASVPLMPLLRAMIQRNEDAVEAFLEAGALEVTNFTPHSRQAPLTLEQRQASFDDLADQIFVSNAPARARFTAALMSRAVTRQTGARVDLARQADDTCGVLQAGQARVERRLRRVGI